MRSQLDIRPAWRRLLGAAAFVVLAGLASVAAVGAEDDDVVDLIDIEGSNLDKGALACTVIKAGLVGVKGAIGFEKKLEDDFHASTTAVGNAMAAIFDQAQIESGVSIDDVDPVDLHVAMNAIQSEFYQSEAARENQEESLTTAATAPGAPKEEWNAFDYSRMALGIASIADPSGVVGVAAAYTYPVCGTPEAETGAGGFCWRASSTRGVGTIPSSLGRLGDCPQGMTNVGLGCVGEIRTRPSHSVVANCPAGFVNLGANCHRDGETRVAGSVTPSCQAGYTNMGLTCYRPPNSYWKGCTTIFKDYPCQAGYTDMGCHCQRWADSTSLASATCPAGYFLNTTTGRCHRNCPAGFQNTGEFCQRWPESRGMDAMSCDAGYFKFGARCYKNCPSGYTSYGEFCVNSNAFASVDAMTCGPGEFKNAEGRCYPTGACGTYTDAAGATRNKEMQAGLCYASCDNGMKGVGPVCWSSCAQSKYKTECAAGCAASPLECSLATIDMVAAPFEVALFAVSLGTASSAGSSRKAAAAAAKAAAREAAKTAAEQGAKFALRRARSAAFRHQVAMRAKEIAERAVVRDALQRMADDAFDAIDDEAFDLVVKWSDEIGEAPQAQRVVRDDLASSLGEQLDELDSAIDEGFDDALSSARSSVGSGSDSGPLLRPVRRDPDAARAPSNRVADRIERSIGRKIKDIDAAQLRFANWANANQTRLASAMKTNVFDPVKRAKEVVVRNGTAVKNYFPNKLRSRSELFDQFMIRKGELSRYKVIGLARAARSCAKLGIEIGEWAEEGSVKR